MTELIGMSIGACDSGGPWSYVLDGSVTKGRFPLIPGL